jgi:hypothetical protein
MSVAAPAQISAASAAASTGREVGGAPTPRAAQRRAAAAASRGRGLRRAPSSPAAARFSRCDSQPAYPRSLTGGLDGWWVWLGGGCVGGAPRGRPSSPHETGATPPSTWPTPPPWPPAADGQQCASTPHDTGTDTGPTPTDPPFVRRPPPPWPRPPLLVPSCLLSSCRTPAGYCSRRRWPRREPLPRPRGGQAARFIKHTISSRSLIANQHNTCPRPRPRRAPEASNVFRFWPNVFWQMTCRSVASDARQRRPRVARGRAPRRAAPCAGPAPSR